MGKKEVTLYTCDRCGHEWKDLPGRPKLPKGIGYHMADITFTEVGSVQHGELSYGMRTSAYWCVDCATRLMELLDDEGYLWDIAKGSEDDTERKGNKS